MDKLPRGILRVTYPTADGVVIKYRVRIRSEKKGIHDRLFAKIGDAKLFLADPTAYQQAEASEAAAAQSQQIGSRTDEEIQERRTQRNFRNTHADPLLDKLFAAYLDEKAYLKTSQAWLARNRHNSLKSFLKILSRTPVENVPGGMDLRSYLMGKSPEIQRIPQKPLGELNASEVGALQIDSYIKARQREGKKRATILKELSILKRTFVRLPKLFPFAAKLDRNPVELYDKELFSAQIKAEASEAKPRRIATSNLETIEAYLGQQKNQQALWAFRLSLATAIRRAEVLELRKDQIHPTHLALTFTKTKKPRNVFLTGEAQELLKAILAQNFTPAADPKLFSLTYVNNYKIWQRMTKAHPELKGITFHTLRKEAISRAILTLAQANQNMPSLFVGAFLGVGNVERFQKEWIDPTLTQPNHDSQAGVLASVGHNNAQTTLKHYLDIASPEK